ncbi:MAG: hypothetical protein JWP78_4056 [Mucilaginibacter sp.]|nr:hypothetical protein [Mucilaginibacter sp.]
MFNCLMLLKVLTNAYSFFDKLILIYSHPVCQLITVTISNGFNEKKV